MKIGQMISTSAKDSDVGDFGIGVHVYVDETAIVQSRNKSVHFNYPFDTS